ncbi:MAG: serine protease [Thermomicrobiales bacterium]|nr:serine protease [Thermomicrobiales bacterium]
MSTDEATTILGRLSEELANAVQHAAAATVTVYARRRLPGSGMVWSAGGDIVTANHVVERDDEITIGLPDGSTVPARLIGREPGVDLALLRAETNDLTPIARSAIAPRVGHLALAIGRPGAGDPMASFGAISTVGGAWRTPHGAMVEGYLRADVAMLPGFSGGPLVDGAGAAIGLNSSTLGRGGGLTIPLGAIDAVVAALQAHGKVRRGYLGVGTQQVRLPDALVNAQALPESRALLILSLEPDSPADRGGLLLGDIIVAIEGAAVTDVEGLQDQLSGERVGQPLTLRLVRGGELRDVTVMVGERG